MNFRKNLTDPPISQLQNVLGINLNIKIIKHFVHFEQCSTILKRKPFFYFNKIYERK